ncbi:hypothetical protein IWQ60_006920 [Tieghemiomyces parasiticus]|uniref:Calcineurin-like phosphoesterase domain-containing protein n=1 Tax=Tieghemiomyces parasiticus TaxID=78921 RepID=A0A9W8DS97_9FUNG|nr:hypothetical protein IWQ60_006920 [Tieghemiomyces parasiticus]
MLATVRPYLLGLLLCTVTVVSWLYGYHVHREATESLRTAPPQWTNVVDDYEAAAVTTDTPVHGDPTVLGDQLDGLFQFIHVSDLHISKFHATGGIVHFLHFLGTAVPLISPAFVVATGDLTDAKDVAMLGSSQYPEEWRAYRTALAQAGMLDRNGGEYWYDLRGNHDCFNVPSWDSDVNYFRTYGVRQSRGYSFERRYPFGSYGFVAVDACPQYGISRPLNFFGFITHTAMDELAERLDHYHATANHTFLFSHYPASTTQFGTVSDGRGFTDLATQFSIYLCGHLHELALGIGKKLKAYKPSHYLELELTDLKLHATYRVLAVDHDMITFKDIPLPLPEIPAPNVPGTGMEPPHVTIPTSLPAPPVVLTTNPKDARYLLPQREPVHRILTSTHIRFLAWSQVPVANVTIQIDGRPHPHLAVYRGPAPPTDEEDTATRVNHVPLWVAPWDPQRYHDGRSHRLVITVTDRAGRTGRDQVTFRVDGRRMSMHNAAQGGWIMQTDFNAWLQRWFLVGYVFMTIGLVLIPKCVGSYLHGHGCYATWRADQSAALIRTDRRSRAAYYRSTAPRPLAYVRYVAARLGFHLRAAGFRLVELQNAKRIFYPFFAYCLYLVTGPWFVGELIPAAAAHQPELAIGYFYLQGLYINRQWVPTSDTWFFAFNTALFPSIFFIMYLAFCTTPPRLLYARDNIRRTLPYHRRWYFRVLVFLGYFYGLLTGIAITAFVYGWRTVVFGPARAWAVLYAGWLLWHYDWQYIILRQTRDAALETAYLPVLKSPTASDDGSEDNSSGSGSGLGDARGRRAARVYLTSEDEEDDQSEDEATALDRPRRGSNHTASPRRAACIVDTCSHLGRSSGASRASLRLVGSASVSREASAESLSSTSSLLTREGNGGGSVSVRVVRRHANGDDHPHITQ